VRAAEERRNDPRFLFAWNRETKAKEQLEELNLTSFSAKWRMYLFPLQLFLVLWDEIKVGRKVGEKYTQRIACS
jgi:hypothetical protein